MKRPVSVTFFSVSLMIYGVLVLMGTGTYSQFAEFFIPYPAGVIFSVYLFNLLYGVCCMYAGSRTLHLAEWARKVIVVMASTSVALGLFFNRTVMSNFRHLLYTGQLDLPQGSADQVIRGAIIFTAAMTLYELSVIVFFTRRKVKDLFR